MKKKTYQFEATGTLWRISLWHDREVSTVRKEVRNFVNDFEKTFSRFRDDSLAVQISGATGVCDVGESFVHLLEIYKKFYAVTDSLFTPLMGKALHDAGYDAQYSFEKQKHTAVPDFLDVLKVIDAHNIEITQPVHFDFGGAGKGYAIDLLAQFLLSNGYKKFLIDAGGDLYYGDKREGEKKSKQRDKLSVGLEHPTDQTRAIGKIEIANQSLCASGALKRQWAQGQHHIMDPTTGESAKDVIATWALSDMAVIADGCATSLFFVAPEKLAAMFDFDYVIMYANGSVKYSDFFKGKLFVAENKEH